MFGAGSNFNMPRPTGAGNIGPPRVHMPDSGGQSMPRIGTPNGMARSSLGPKLKPFPQTPMHSMSGTANSLIQSQSKHGNTTSGVGLDGLRGMGM